MPWGSLAANGAPTLLPAGTKYNANTGYFSNARWVSLTCTNGFADRWDVPGTASDQNFDLVGYYADQRGYITLSGRVNASLVGATWANNSVAVFNIPAPYRPTKTIGWIMTNDQNAAILGSMDSGGSLILWCPTATAPAVLNLDGLTYYCGTPGRAAVNLGTIPANGKTDPLTGTPTLELINFASPFTGAFSGTNNQCPDDFVSGQVLYQGAYQVTSGTAADAIAASNPLGVVGDYSTGTPGTREIFPCATTSPGSSSAVVPQRVDISHELTGSFYQAKLRPEFAMAINQIAYLNNICYNSRSGTGFPADPLGPNPANAQMWTDGFSGFSWQDAMGTDWVNLTMTAPWVNYGAPYRGLQAKRDAYGHVYLRGLIKDGTPGTTIATLPAEMRPTLTQHCVCWTSQGLSCIQVSLNTGIISVLASRNYTGGVGQWVSLGGVRVASL